MRGRGRLSDSASRRSEQQRARENQGEAKQLRTTLPQRRSGKLAYNTRRPSHSCRSDSKDTPYYGGAFTLSSRMSKTNFFRAPRAMVEKEHGRPAGKPSDREGAVSRSVRVMRRAGIEPAT
jgi:hypothetical protein